ncbi:hypothetical protein Q8A67_022086 [Cirrhinus molitorella]|uniref:Uncharacterized protein n=1 Tax=Cirrhinus molitorella TaxID=172907 RepID=A0AA88P8T8_9TELE|nr:hypothetical protein Q8A67_022086 [Cirrhinus molitorella]
MDSINRGNDVDLLQTFSLQHPGSSSGTPQHLLAALEACETLNELLRTLTSRSHSSQTSLQSFITDFGAESQHMNLSREPITNRARGQKQRRSSWLRLFELARLRLLSLAEPRGCS